MPTLFTTSQKRLLQLTILALLAVGIMLNLHATSSAKSKFHAMHTTARNVAQLLQTHKNLKPSALKRFFYQAEHSSANLVAESDISQKTFGWSQRQIKWSKAKDAPVKTLPTTTQDYASAQNGTTWQAITGAEQIDGYKSAWHFESNNSILVKNSKSGHTYDTLTGKRILITPEGKVFRYSADGNNTQQAQLEWGEQRMTVKGKLTIGLGALGILGSAYGTPAGVTGATNPCKWGKFGEVVRFCQPLNVEEPESPPTDPFEPMITW